MILTGRSNAAYLNSSKAHIQAGAHIFLSEYDHVPQINVSILIISQIIKFVMSSAAEVELTGLFITAKTMIPI